MARFSPTGRMLEARGLYRRWLAKHFSTVSLAGLAPDDEPILLRQIYVPLVLTPKRVSEYEPEEAIHQEGRPIEDWLVETGTAEGLLPRLVGFFRPTEQKPRTFLISGEAGSGKTTLVSSLVDSLAGTAGDVFNRRFEGYLPFPILLREAPLDRIESLSDLVAWWIESVRVEEKALIPADLTTFLDAGHGVLLLDGLDEVGTLERRSQVLGWLKEHRWTQSATPNIAIVTARPSGFEGLKDASLPPAWSLHVAPFSNDQIRQYLERWFELRPMLLRQRQETIEALLHRLARSEEAQRLLPLARRPAYLAGLAFVHGTRGELPYTRAALYELLIEAYIEMLDRQRGLSQQFQKADRLPWDRQEKLEVLSAVAFQAHTGVAAIGPGKSDRRFLWNRAELQDAVRNAILYGGDRLRTMRPEDAPDLTDYLLARTGLLVEARESHFQFGHLSFQEYLTALFLLNLASASEDKVAVLRTELFPRLALTGWLEVALLLLAIDSNRSGGKGHQPILGALSLADPSQRSLLSEVLAGKELRLTPTERRSWLIVWASHIERIGNLDQRVASLRDNYEALEEIWNSTCEALIQGRPLGETWQSLLGKSGEIASLGRQPSSALDSLLGFHQAAIEIPRSKLARENPPLGSREDTAAAILSLPFFSELRPRDPWKQLQPILDSVALFPLENEGSPSPIWFVMDNWALVLPELERILAERTPLVRWLVDSFFALRASSSARIGDSGLLRWRLSLWLQSLRIERFWWVDRLMHCSNPSELMGRRASGQKQPSAENSFQDLDVRIGRLLDRGVNSEVQDMALRWIGSLSPARAQALSEARGLAQHRDRTRDLPYDRHQVREPPLDHVYDQNVFLALLLSPSKILRDSRFSGWQLSDRKYRPAMVPFLNIQALDHMTADLGPGVIRREELDMALSTLRNPVLAARILREPSLRWRAEQEWSDVLDSQESPIPLLEDLLSRDWQELALAQDSVLETLEKVLADL